jgi:hypothetical protein
VPEGWHFGEGVPPSPEVIALAWRLYSHATALGFTETDAFLGTNGEVRLTVYSHSNYFEFTVELDRSITFVKEENGREAEPRERLSVQDALTILNRAGHELWASYAFSTTGTTTTVSGVFSPSSSEILQTDLAYP